MARRKLEGSITLKYGGRPSEIDADTFLISLSGLSESIAAVGMELGAGQVKINVKAPQPGSFQIDLSVIPQTLQGLWDSTKPAREIISAWVSYLKLKQLLRGEKPKQILEKGGNVEIKHNNVTINIDKAVFNFIQIIEP